VEWAVGITVTDTGNDRIVSFVALGMGLLARSVISTLDQSQRGQNAKIGTSNKGAQQMADAFGE